ncbi:MAG: N-acetyltransferase [Candidatus Altiarchaeota archaeon]|nr:N-acetyltransferase [Candidatus Altiarchaeota archaeon]
MEDSDHPGTVVGKNAVIRPGCTFYSNVSIGNDLRTGHNVLVRERTQAGDRVLLGTNVVIDGQTLIGSNVSIQSNVYIPLNTLIEDHVFLGPCAALTNDKYPIREPTDLPGVKIRKGASIGSNAVILPGIEIGSGAIIGSGSVVTRDVPPWKIVAGNPAKVIKDVPEKHKVLNRI